MDEYIYEVLRRMETLLEVLVDIARKEKEDSK